MRADAAPRGHTVFISKQMQRVDILMHLSDYRGTPPAIACHADARNAIF